MLLHPLALDLIPTVRCLLADTPVYLFVSSLFFPMTKINEMLIIPMDVTVVIISNAAARSNSNGGCLSTRCNDPDNDANAVTIVQVIRYMTLVGNWYGFFSIVNTTEW